MGAAPGTDVYSPVDGTIVGITPLMLRGKVFGARIDVQPTNEPALVVRLTHLRPDPALTVGSSVAAAISKIGTIIDEHRATEPKHNNITLSCSAAAAHSAWLHSAPPRDEDLRRHLT